MGHGAESDLARIRHRIRRAYLAHEPDAMRALADQAGLSAAERGTISTQAVELVDAVRSSTHPSLMESFLGEYGLSTSEGVALMCLAEALLRVPDAETIDNLIRDKIVPHDWGAHFGDSGSNLVNASTWALMLTGRVLEPDTEGGIVRTVRELARRLGEPVIRTAVGRAMEAMGAQFVLGQSMAEALSRGEQWRARGYTYSFDRLGEAARTHADASRYHDAYLSAIAELSKTPARPADQPRGSVAAIAANPGLSVKLSALHPRYEFAQRLTAGPQLAERLLALALAAAEADLGLNIDAEEADRLDLSLDLIEQVLSQPQLRNWSGLGIVVQAYGPRAPHVIDWLDELTGRLDRRIMVRLVKGAYWDTEIKRAQVMGLAGFPVFTRKSHTDIAYLACAAKLLASKTIYPQFATHNAHTAAAVRHLAERAGVAAHGFEFQRLHGMGEALHDLLCEDGARCRIYAPVGTHQDLLAYLVRRLLENGANSSFVHQIVDTEISADRIAKDPFAELAKTGGRPNPAIARPPDLFSPDRRNSQGCDLTDPLALAELEAARAPFAAPHSWQAAPTMDGAGPVRDLFNPADPDDRVGWVRETTAAEISKSVQTAAGAQPDWAAIPVSERARRLAAAADLFEQNRAEIYALLAREAGKTLPDAVDELREAVDFLRYYGAEAEKAERDTAPQGVPRGVPRGVIACVSPWNFPLAIFTGQIAAAIVTGNAVVAKPAEQTPLVAARAVAWLHAAGVPPEVLQLAPGDGPSTGSALVNCAGIAGVCFTGSTQVARIINRSLAENAAPDAMLIAETGGLNAMIVDSTALPEQAVRDIVASAFQSSGQRCSALRILYVQADIEDRLLPMLTGAMDTLSLGDPWHLSTDLGPVIDHDAFHALTTYCDQAERTGRLVKQLDGPDRGLFVPPALIRVDGIHAMGPEVFGPVLHIASYQAADLAAVISAINAKGYGLTFGLHTRIDRRVQDVVDTVAAGNLYINRNQIGAVVGSQPFGGEGLSGTGPKAGGPHYLRRFGKPRFQDQPAPDRSATEPEPGDFDGNFPEFPDNSVWAARRDRIGALRASLRGRAATAMSAAAALDTGPIDLPGPTGESNRLSLVPRGRVLVLGPDPETAVDQAVQALALGNSVVAAGRGFCEAIAPLTEAGLPVVGTDTTPGADHLAALALDAVAHCGSAGQIAPLRKALAERDGPLVRLISDRVDPTAYGHERAVCVDTTAAGGNASLLARAG